MSFLDQLTVLKGKQFQNMTFAEKSVYLLDRLDKISDLLETWFIENNDLKPYIEDSDDACSEYYTREICIDQLEKILGE